jgi:hypothetical protein
MVCIPPPVTLNRGSFLAIQLDDTECSLWGPRTVFDLPRSTSSFGVSWCSPWCSRGAVGLLEPNKGLRTRTQKEGPEVAFAASGPYRGKLKRARRFELLTSSLGSYASALM